MPDGVFLGFDFGYRRIGVSVGQRLTRSASPLSTLAAEGGVPRWEAIQQLIRDWQPEALIVGLPSHIDGSEQYTTHAARNFSRELNQRFGLPVHLVDERFSTKEARARLFAEGGYQQLKKAQIDSIAACVILEQWLQGAS